MGLNLKNFKDFEKNIGKLMTSKTVKATLKVELPKNRTEFNIDRILLDFGNYFVQKAFVENFLKPAFLTGRGIPGYGGYGGNAKKFAPQIVRGMDAYGQVTGETDGQGKYKRTSDSNPLERRLLAAVDRGDTEAALKIQKRIEKKEQDQFAQTIQGTDISSTWAQGFDKMLENLTTVTPARKEGNKIVIGIGPGAQILAQQLSSYRVTQGLNSKRPSSYNSFFYAAEFGTGIGENVGGDQWIRHEVTGKDQTEKTTYQGKAGHWWFGNKTASGQWTGGLFSGQKGLHFFYDPSTREERPEFGDWIRKNIQKEFAEFIKGRL